MQTQETSSNKPVLEPKDKLALVKEEYFVLLKFYEDFDARLLTIKGWSTTVGVAAIGLGIQNSKPLLCLFGSSVAILFWLLEATWKGLQHSYGPRIAEIEAAYRSGAHETLVPLQAHANWASSWKKSLNHFRRNIFRPIVALPHAITAIAGFLLYRYWACLT